VSAGLNGLREVCVTAFPGARHKSCWVHISRAISRLIRPKDKAEILGGFKKIYRAAHQEVAQAVMDDLILRIEGRYPKVGPCFDPMRVSSPSMLSQKRCVPVSIPPIASKD